MGNADIKKAVTLYERMAKRLRESGFGDRQAQVYEEMTRLIASCETMPEAQERIKNSPYYLAPGAALLQDQLAALARANSEKNMDDVAEVYEQKIAEIDTDVNSMYEIGHDQRAARIKAPYLETYEAFGRLYNHYVSLVHGNLIDDVVMQGASRDLKETLGKLSKPDSNFSALAQREEFRDLVPITQEGYDVFVTKLTAIVAGGADFSKDKKQQEAEYKKTQKALHGERQRIKEVGSRNQAGVRRSRVKVHAPDTKDGKYRYSDEEVKPFA